MKRTIAAITLLTGSIMLPTGPAGAMKGGLRAWCAKVHNQLPYAGMIRETFPEEPIMTRVSCCESQGNPKARSRTSDYGLGQVNWPVWNRALRDIGLAESPTDLFDPGTGVSAMRYVYDVQGLAAWRPSRPCWR